MMLSDGSRKAAISLVSVFDNTKRETEADLHTRLNT